jgi:3'-phosphoadenosine 5'-phosphosulfate sulfotransferase (PAPS reductase)/FAD synthetase
VSLHVAAFSGGKDSTALLCWLQDEGIRFTAVFSDTGWEHPLTYAYIEEINQRLLGGALIRLKPDEWIPEGTTERYTDMRDLVTRKGRVPSVRARFCTEYLKTNPMRAWIAAQDEDVVLYQGIRAEESPARAVMAPSEWSDYYDCQVERPLFRWTAPEIFVLLALHGIPANPLYRLGAKRVGCFPCVLTRHAELRRLSKSLPEVWDRIAELERLSGHSYFPPGYIPERFNTGRDPKTGLSFPTAADVRRYLFGMGEEQLAMYGETPACTSVYNLCE